MSPDGGPAGHVSCGIRTKPAAPAQSIGPLRRTFLISGGTPTTSEILGWFIQIATSQT